MIRHCLPLISLVLLVACSSTTKVKVPPRVTLERTDAIGVFAFDADGADESELHVTDKFIEAIHAEQPGVPFLDLGDLDQALAQVGETRLTRQAACKIGQLFGLDYILTGNLHLKESDPSVDVDLDRGISRASFKSALRLDGSLDARLLETGRGAAVWIGTSSRWIELAGLAVNTSGTGSLDLPDRERQYEQLVSEMVWEASIDYRCRWERQPTQ